MIKRMPSVYELMLRRNPPDEALRELERMAEHGDHEAAREASRERLRRGLTDLQTEIVREIVRSGDLMGWRPAIEYMGTLTWTPLSSGPPWGFLLAATPDWDGDWTMPVELQSNEGGAQGITIVQLPETQDPFALATFCRAHMAEIFDRAAKVFFARAAGICVCASIVEPTCPTHGELYALLS